MTGILKALGAKKLAGFKTSKNRNKITRLLQSINWPASNFTLYTRLNFMFLLLAYSENRIISLSFPASIKISLLSQSCHGKLSTFSTLEKTPNVYPEKVVSGWESPYFLPGVWGHSFFNRCTLDKSKVSWLNIMSWETMYLGKHQAVSKLLPPASQYHSYSIQVFNNNAGGNLRAACIQMEMVTQASSLVTF